MAGWLFVPYPALCSFAPIPTPIPCRSARGSCVSSPARGYGSGVCAQRARASPSLSRSPVAPSSLPRGGEGAENVPAPRSQAPSGAQSTAPGPSGLASLGLRDICDLLGENHRVRWGKVSHWGLNAGSQGAEPAAEPSPHRQPRSFSRPVSLSRYPRVPEAHLPRVCCDTGGVGPPGPKTR